MIKEYITGLLLLAGSGTPKRRASCVVQATGEHPSAILRCETETVAQVAIAAQAVMLALGVQLNMLNFAAVPITIGVGADYVVNLIGAMDAFGVNARRACARR